MVLVLRVDLEREMVIGRFRQFVLFVENVKDTSASVLDQL